MYILLAGYPPFNGKNQRELFRLIRKGRYEFHEEFWGGVSDDAKTLVSGLLNVDPKRRLSPEQAINSTWMTKSFLSGRGNLDKNLGQFKKFNAKRKLKQGVLAVSYYIVI